MYTQEEAKKIVWIYRKARFQIEDGEVFPGFTRGEHWNGWACPFFIYDVAVKIAEYYHPPVEKGCQPESHWRYEETTDSFLFFSADDEAYDVEHGEIYEPYTCKGMDIVVNGENFHVYDIGMGAWCWDEVEHLYCHFCGDEIEGDTNYLECKDPEHGEPVQFCGSDCAGAYLAKKMCDCKVSP